MIEVISGTNRRDGNTIKVARLIVRLYERLGQQVGLMDLQELPQEIFHPDAYLNKPASFAPWQERVLNARGLHVVVPEYNGSFPGALKYFIDMLKFPESFDHHLVAYTGISSGIWGGFRAVEQLQQVFGYRNAFNLPERVWIPAIHKKLGADGASLNDAMANQLLEAQALEFIEFLQRNEHVKDSRFSTIK
jgi:chromate reductase